MSRHLRAGAPGESGSALVEFCWVGLILFIPITWIVLTVFEVQQGAFAVNGAARAAARAYALAPDDATGLVRAQAVVDQTLLDQGGDGRRGGGAGVTHCGVLRCRTSGGVGRSRRAGGQFQPAWAPPTRSAAICCW